MICPKVLILLSLPMLLAAPGWTQEISPEDPTSRPSDSIQFAVPKAPAPPTASSQEVGQEPQSSEELPEPHLPVEIEDYPKIFALLRTNSEGARNQTSRNSNAMLLILGETDAPSPDFRSQFGDQIESLHEWMDQLGSTRFARREYATHALFQQGFEIVPLLRQRLAAGADAETRLRLLQLLQTLEAAYVESMRVAFFQGQDDIFPGWTVAKRLMGDTSATRQIYADIYQENPQISWALDGTTEDRSEAIDSVLSQPRLESRASLAGMLLAAADPEYQPTLGVQKDMLGWFRVTLATDLRFMRDSMAFGEKLMGSFLLKTSLEDRDEWLHAGVDRRLPATEILAQRTLKETDHPPALAAAMSCLVVYGSRDSIDQITPFMEDKRALENGWVLNGKLLELRVSDVALATIASLLGKRTDEVGFPANVNHPKFGLDISRLGLPADEPSRATAIRLLIRKNVDNLLLDRRDGMDENKPLEAN